jgi:uncharacterized protein
MTSIERQIASLDWPEIIEQLLTNGYSQVESVLSDQQCDQLKDQYQDDFRYRKTVNMQRFRFGKGEYRYFNYPLPNYVQQLRETIYRYLVPVANAWMKQLKIDCEYPMQHPEFIKLCQSEAQHLATPLILKYQRGGFNTLHQDLYGSVYFPIQLVINLSQEGVDYKGGELVLTEQIPRAQSCAKVLRPNKGDMIIFSTNFRPQLGTRGFYRVTMKHGVSEVTQGTRYALGVIFHDAKT